jgi:hypothetical protein
MMMMKDANVDSGDDTICVLCAGDVGWSGILVIISALMEIAAGLCMFLPVHQGQVEFITVS